MSAFFFSSRRRHTSLQGDWSSDVCSSDLSATARRSAATLATWYVDHIEQIVDELTAAGVEFARYDEFEHDARGIKIGRASCRERVEGQAGGVRVIINKVARYVGVRVAPGD